MKSSIFSFLILFSGLAIAGGDYFPIQIIDISYEKDDFEFTAIPTKERPWMDKECTKISVKGYFDTFKWLTYKKPMSFENHMASLDYLSKAHASKNTVYFGYIGAGLHKVSECSYESKALLYDTYNKEHVLSAYESI